MKTSAKLPTVWKFIALLALISYAGAVTIIVLLTFGNPLLMCSSLAVLLGALYGIWLIFTGTGKRIAKGWVFIGLSLGLLLSVLYIFAQRDRLWWIILAFGLLLIFAYCVSRVRNYTLTVSLSANKHGRPTFNKPVLIINPKSGDGRAIKADIPGKAEAMGIQVVITKRSDNIEQLARDAVASGCDVLGVSGGDGTLGAVAKVAIDNNLPLVVLPGGTRCHFARDIGLDPNRIVDSLLGFSGIERRVDVGEINGRIFLNNASFGLYADIVDNQDYRDNKLAVTRQILSDHVSGKKALYDLRFLDAQKTEHTQALQILVGINSYESLKLFELGHRKLMDSGELQINVMAKIDDSIMKKLMTNLTITKYIKKNKLDNLLQWTAKKFVVNSASQQLVVGVDGEREEYNTPVVINIKPQALRLMVPAGISHQRPASPFGKETLTELARDVSGR